MGLTLDLWQFQFGENMGKMTIEIVSFPMKNGDFPLICKRLSEGTHHGMDSGSKNSGRKKQAIWMTWMAISNFDMKTRQITQKKHEKTGHPQTNSQNHPENDHHPSARNSTMKVQVGTMRIILEILHENAFFLPRRMGLLP